MRLHLGLLLVAMLACGGGGGEGDPYDNDPTGPPGNTPNPPPNSTPSNSAEVEMTRVGDGYGSDIHGFAPTRVTISRGGTVTWRNDTGLSHNVTFGGSNAPERVTDFTGGSQARTFPAAGTFAYSCTNHSGMTGEVVVQ